MSQSSKRKTFLIMTALVTMTLVVYWQVQQFEFVNIDDPLYVTGNPHVLRGLSGENVQWALTSGYAAMWIPFTWISLMLDAQLYGQFAGGFHRTNLLLHMANVLLLFLALRQMTGATWRSGFVAALFAVHPLHVESVAWVTERKDVLSLFFGLLAILAYGRYARQPRATLYVFALIAFACSLLAKPMLVTLPFLMLLFDFWPLGRWQRGTDDSIPARALQPDEGIEERATLPDAIGATCPSRPWHRLLMEKIPFLLLAAACSLLTFLAEKQGGALPTFAAYSFASRAYNAVVVYVLYIGKTIWPANLSVFYPHPGDAIPASQVAGALFVLLVVSVVAVASIRRHPYVFVGWFWYLGTLVPMIGLVQVGAYRMADRFTYFPIVGLFVAISWLAPALLPADVRRRCMAPAIPLVLLAALTCVGYRQTSFWRNSETLFRHAIEATDNNALAHNNLGLALEQQERFEEAIGHYQSALDIDSEGVEAYNNLGIVFHRQGRFDEAIQQYEQALRVAPRFAITHANFAAALAGSGRPEEAIHHYREALDIDPNHAGLHQSLGLMLRKLGRFEEAKRHFDKANALSNDGR
jgi:Tfp pilus assembly protein PilF